MLCCQRFLPQTTATISLTSNSSSRLSAASKLYCMEQRQLSLWYNRGNENSNTNHDNWCSSSQLQTSTERGSTEITNKSSRLSAETGVTKRIYQQQPSHCNPKPTAATPVSPPTIDHGNSALCSRRPTCSTSSRCAEQAAQCVNC